jgi:predicted DCC family thiol-disulfide oxidoreductase YuxK
MLKPYSSWLYPKLSLILVSKNMEGNREIIVFDSTCLLCNRAVHFILKFSLKNSFNFTSIESDASKRILLQLNQKTFEFDSLALWKNQELFYKSKAIEQIMRKIPITYPLFILFLLPRSLKDSLYDYVAKNRYSWFGKTDTCKFIPDNDSNQFLK